MCIIIPEVVEKCINRLSAAGFEAFVVGGCVRDSLIGRDPNDWDICTSALPEETKEIFKEYRIVDIGIAHGTVAVIFNKENIEITTYRVEGEYKDNRRPENVEFTSKVEDDLSRRDFTINAMAYNAERGLVDFFYGKEDLKEKVIRCVGEPNKRFNEDALRIMRAFRFAAQLNYIIDSDTLMAIEENKMLLKNLSVERIAVELNKLILSEEPERMIKLLFEMNIFSIIIEVIHNCNLKVDKIKNLTENCGQIIRNCPQDLPIRLCILLNYIIEGYGVVDNSRDREGFEVEVALIAEKILRGLRYDSNTIKEVSTLALYYHRNIPCNRVELKKILSLIDVELFKKLIYMKDAMGKIRSREYIEMLKSIEINKECFKIKDLKINGKDLISLGARNGKIIGDILNVFLEMVIENPEMNRRETLLELGKNLIHCI